LPRAPAGEVLVLVEFTVDVDGILHVSASEMASGQRPELYLVATAGLTRADRQRIRAGLALRR
jgi:molecular chaperone DnaK